MGPFGPSVPIFILFSILWSSVNCAHFDLQLVPSLTDGDYQHLYRVAVQCFDGQQNPRGTITGNGVAPMNTNGESGMKFEKIGINFGNGRDCKEFEVQISMVNKDDDKWAIWVIFKIFLWYFDATLIKIINLTCEILIYLIKTYVGLC